MRNYLLVTFCMLLLFELAQTTSWRPRGGVKDWHHAIIVAVLSPGFFWLLFY